MSAASFVQTLFDRKAAARALARWQAHPFKPWNRDPPPIAERRAEREGRRRSAAGDTLVHRLFDFGALPKAFNWPSYAFKPWSGSTGAGGEEEGALDRADMKKIAASCNRTELVQILKFGDEGAILEALQNPSLEIGDIEGLAARPKTSTNVLAAIGRRREWSAAPEVAKALCLNAKAPYFVTRGLLPYLPGSDVVELSKNTMIPPGLQKDARKLLDARRTRRMSK